MAKKKDEEVTKVSKKKPSGAPSCDHCSEWEAIARSMHCVCGQNFVACYGHMSELVAILGEHKASCTFVPPATAEETTARQTRKNEQAAAGRVFQDRMRISEEAALDHAVRKDHKKKEAAARPSASTFAKAIQKKARDAAMQHAGRRSPMKIQEGMMAPVKGLQKKPLSYPALQPRARTTVAPANTTFDMQKPMPKVQNQPKPFHPLSGPVVSRATPNKNIAQMPDAGLRQSRAQTYYKTHALPKKPY